MMMKSPEEKKKLHPSLNLYEYECEKCQDTEWVTFRDQDGYEYAKECDCKPLKVMRRRFKNALIPDEFKEARFDNYIRKTETQNILYNGMIEYLKNFETNKNSKKNSLGFIAIFGEQRIKELNFKERAEVKRKHNSFGLGKTHIQAAAAKWLIKNNHGVLMISDAVFMDDLIQAKMTKDEGTKLHKLLDSAINVPVLIWDDIGKSKWSEAKESLYYQIINERYRNHKPIIFSSNEDDETLSEKIGYAAASRLFGMAKENLYAVEGTDYRVEGE
jgi:DNA replication protein DnaC